MKRLRIAAVGDNCIDKFLSPSIGEALVGGNAVNVAVHLAKLGHEAFYLGAVGPDVDGRRTRTALIENGVAVAHMQERLGKTAHTDIEVLPSGERVFLFEDFGVCAGYRPSEEDIAALKTMDHVHIGWVDDGGALRHTLAAAGVSVSQDVSVNADPANLGIEGLTIAFGSAGEDDRAVEAMIDRFLSAGVRVAVVTRGAKGSVAATLEERAETGIMQVEVVDTTGAGDSFIAGFLSVHVGGGSLQDAVEAGRDRAALTCSHVGGFPQKPTAL
ncbi:fructoselysine 6-kinase [Rhizobium leguminosarum]|uniref:PfkB family carbohydrate kinase n=1 Tax=Rhizobium leguminosarum TaxID=384 RepID=UPI001C959538|nr:PfkB family carbohydrate kinase [Rhizobium leguminosarum]MBY5572023.1 fructoselysine 6-kinase [Rhizobium leguminosarum]MBY5578519.1 fructoselysine 6-kinase [Rhizobium leguminosarum]